MIVQREQVFARQVEQLRTQIAQVESAVSGTAQPAPAPDFVQRLPRVPDVRALLVEIERSAGGAGISVGSMQLQERAANAEQLARADVTISLRGSYPKLKQVLADVLGRFQNVTLVQWRLRRTIQPTDLETTMILTVWGSATGTAPSAAAPVETIASGAAR